MQKRVFIGLRPPQPLLDYINSTLSSLRVVLDRAKAEIQWVPMENYHVTLSFIGEIEDEGIALIQQAIEKLSLQSSPVKLEISGLSCFPSIEAARVLIAELKEGRDLIQFQSMLHEEIVSLGVLPDQKPFRPHITLGRMRKQKNLKDALSTAPKAKRIKGKAGDIFLFQSTKGTSSNHYLELLKSPFQELSEFD